MKSKIANALAFGAAFAAPLAMMAADPTPSPVPSQVQTHLRLNIKDDVGEVHFISANNDPDVFSKVYILKNTDPYELRPYLIGAVGGYYDSMNQPNIEIGRRVNASTTKVECIKYMDGVGALVVSAEDFRFTDTAKLNGGMSIDEIVTVLDQPGMIWNNSQSYLLYFPKYWDAASLANVVQKCGLTTTMDPWELDGGTDSVRVDNYLNGLLFYYPSFSKKQFEQVLALYDKPSPEALINYTVYEYAKEIDSQVGDDFQNWLNGPGSDLFSAGMNSSKNWDATTMTSLAKTGSANTKYINFSPKWSTKYVDFLASKGMAQVVTSGTLSVMNSSTGYVGNTSQIPTIVTGASRASGGITGSRYIVGSGDLSALGFTVVTDTTTFPFTTSTVAPYTDKGVSLDTPMVTGGGTGSYSIVEGQVSKYDGNGNNVISYVYLIKVSAGSITAGGKSLGTSVRAYSSSQITFTTNYNSSLGYGDPASWTTGSSTDTAYAPLAIQKAPKRNTQIQTITTDSDSYGFEMAVTPTVNENASTLNLSLVNTNLIGFNSDGSVRTSRSEYSTQVSVANDGSKFVIGGINKDQVLRSENGFPWLNSIPGLGWAFASERESHKKSQVVAVIECVPVMPDTTVPAGIMGEISATKTKIENYGTKCGVIDENDYGFDQFLLDVDKKSLDPLP